jgi:hypothetical protein
MRLEQCPMYDIVLQIYNSTSSVHGLRVDECVLFETVLSNKCP